MLSDTAKKSGRAAVLILVDEFADSRGGTEQHVLFLLDQLPRHALRVYFGVLSGVREFDSALFPVEAVFLRSGCRSGLRGVVQRLRNLAAFITSNRIDVVHAFSPVSELSALLATGLAGRGRVLGVRRNCGHWHTRSTVWQARLLSVSRATYVANCEAAKRYATEAEWIPGYRISVIPNPVVTQRLVAGFRSVPPRESLGILDGEQVVGIVANVRPVKDHCTFVRAAHLVLDQLPRTRFIAVGDQDPETFPDVEVLARTLGIDGQITWTGPAENPYSLLPHFDVGVLSSRSEAFPNALLEYAAAGVPAVATDVGGTRELIEEGQTGFLVPPAKPELMAERICRLLRDPELRRRLGEQARVRARSLFFEEGVLQEYVRLYQRLANHQRAPAA